jgi:hypothetical protein
MANPIIKRFRDDSDNENLRAFPEREKRRDSNGSLLRVSRRRCSAADECQAQIGTD